MIFRAIDGTNDWSFGSGIASYFTDEAAINANIRTRLQTWLNECFFALDLGVDWRNLLGGKNPQSQSGIILQCRTIIINSFGVIRINKVDQSIDVTTRKLTVTYLIDTIFTRGLSGSVTL